MTSLARKLKRTQQKQASTGLPEVKPWRGTPAGQLLANPRAADFWRRNADNTVDCSLCYRLCRIKPGEAGWCRHRINEAGKMAIPHYGQLGSVRRSRLGPNGGAMYVWDPGALCLVVGGTHCTSSCKFCTSAQIVWNPDKLQWLPRAELGGKTPPIDGRRWSGNNQSWFHARGMMHPTGILHMAAICRATHILFGDNEPTLTIEYTHDVLRLAKLAGLKTAIFTNGFTEVKPIQMLAPHTHAVDIGVKGSLAPAFYAKWMRSPGADAAVWRSLLEWKKAGVHLVVSNLLAPPQIQTDEEFTEASKRFYGFLAENLGELTLLNQGRAHFPTGHPLRRSLLVPQNNQAEAYENHYLRRFLEAKQLARDAGLVYEHSPSDDIHCHHCAGLLLRYSPHHCKAGDADGDDCTFYRTYCSGCEWHEQWFTDDGKHCAHCGGAVPVKALTKAGLKKAYSDIADLEALGEAQFNLKYEMPPTVRAALR